MSAFSSFEKLFTYISSSNQALCWFRSNLQVKRFSGSKAHSSLNAHQLSHFANVKNPKICLLITKAFPSLFSNTIHSIGSVPLSKSLSCSTLPIWKVPPISVFRISSFKASISSDSVVF